MTNNTTPPQTPPATEAQKATAILAGYLKEATAKGGPGNLASAAEEFALLIAQLTSKTLETKKAANSASIPSLPPEAGLPGPRLTPRCTEAPDRKTTIKHCNWHGKAPQSQLPRRWGKSSGAVQGASLPASCISGYSPTGKLRGRQTKRDRNSPINASAPSGKRSRLIRRTAGRVAAQVGEPA